MKITDAAQFQASFDAVLAGAASPAQCEEVGAVAHELGAYLREAALRATALPERREKFEALLDVTSKAALAAALPIDVKAVPRLVLDDVTGQTMTLAERDELEASRAAPAAVDVAPLPPIAGVAAVI